MNRKDLENWKDAWVKKNLLNSDLLDTGHGYYFYSKFKKVKWVENSCNLDLFLTVRIRNLIFGTIIISEIFMLAQKSFFFQICKNTGAKAFKNRFNYVLVWLFLFGLENWNLVDFLYDAALYKQFVKNSKWAKNVLN